MTVPSYTRQSQNTAINSVYSGRIAEIVAGAAAGGFTLLLVLSAVLISGLVCQLLKYKKAMREVQKSNMNMVGNECYISTVSTDVNMAYGTANHTGHEDQTVVYDHIV